MRLARPFHGDTPLRLVKWIVHVRTIPGVHRDTLAARHVPNNFFPADRVTTLRAIDQRIVMSGDLERRAITATKHAPYDAGDAAGFRLVVARRGRFGIDRRRQLREDAPRRELAVSNPGQQFVRLAQAVLIGNFREVIVANFLQRNAILSRFLLDQLAADFNGALALVDVEPVLDLLP